MLKKIRYFIKSDVELHCRNIWEDGVKRIDGFNFISKKPFSNSYQYHAPLTLECTYRMLKLIQRSIKENKRSLTFKINHGMSCSESITIWKSSFKKAEKLMFDLIENIQKQY